MKFLDFFKKIAGFGGVKKNSPSPVKKKLVSRFIAIRSFFNAAIKSIFSGISLSKGTKKIWKSIKLGTSSVARGTALGISKVGASISAGFVGIISFFKNGMISTSQGVASGISWIFSVIKNTGLKIGYAFTALTASISKGTKKIWDGIRVGLSFAFRLTILGISKVGASISTGCIKTISFLKNCVIAVYRGVVFIITWIFNAVKNTVLKVGYVFAALIAFINNGIKNIWNGIRVGLSFAFRMTILGISKVGASISTGCIKTISFLKNCVIAIYRGVVFIISWIGNLIKFVCLSIWLLIASVFHFFNTIIFGTARGIRVGFVCSKAFVNKRLKFVATSFALVAVIVFLVFTGQRYFKGQSELMVNSQNSQDEFIKTLDQKLSVTQAEIKKYIDQKFEESNKDLDSLKEIDQKLDTKLSTNQNEIKEYIDQTLKKNEKEPASLKAVHQNLSDRESELNNRIYQKTHSSQEVASLKNLDQKLSVTQEKITKYIDEKLQNIDKKIDSLKEEKKSARKNVDGTIKEAVKSQMLSLKEERLRKLIKKQAREKRKKLIRKMLEEDDEEDL